MTRLSPTEKDLKVIATYFADHGGCKAILCENCPCYLRFKCDLQNKVVRKYRLMPANEMSKQWAIEYLEQIEKLEFLESLK